MYSNIDLKHGNIQNAGIDFKGFKEYLVKNHHKRTQNLILCYVRRYYSALDNVLELNSLHGYPKTHAIKSPIVLSKFLGRFEIFKYALKQHGIRAENNHNNLDSFSRILNAQSNNVLKWFSEVMPYMRDNEKLFSKFALATGLRMSEAIDSFNLTINLRSEGKLHEYYDESLSCLQHFRFKDLFIRRTKSAYISFVSVDLIRQIADSQPVSYSAIKKNLERKKDSHVMKFNLCRDYFGTHLLKNGVLQEEVNLLQGRIPSSIFIRHYWSPSFKELKDRTLRAITELTQTLN